MERPRRATFCFILALNSVGGSIELQSNPINQRKQIFPISCLSCSCLSSSPNSGGSMETHAARQTDTCCHSPEPESRFVESSLARALVVYRDDESQTATLIAPTNGCREGLLKEISSQQRAYQPILEGHSIMHHVTNQSGRETRPIRLFFPTERALAVSGDYTQMK